jgi:hypothetical protein
MAHASEQERADVAIARQRWRDLMRHLEPRRLICLDESGATTNMARRFGRSPRGERCLAAIPHGHVWTPRSEQEESAWTGTARDRVRSCVRPLVRHTVAAGPYGMRGSGPHHWNALGALPMRLVLLIPPHRRCAIPVL